MALFWLSGEAWAMIEPHLPKNQPGARHVDDRRVISGIVHVLKVNCRWCGCPADYSPSATVYNRSNRWSRRGFWLKLFGTLVDAGTVAKSTAIDSTYIRAQSAAFGGWGADPGDRSLARRLDDQGPRAHRRHWSSLCADAHTQQCQRHQGGTCASRTRWQDALPVGRQGL